MSNNPRPESRLSELESEMGLQKARIRELADDTAESLRDLKQDIKQLNDGMMSSFKKIGDTFIETVANKEDLEPLATKDDISRLEARIDDKMTAMETRIIDTFKQLLQQKSGE
jgi:uncharacterized coiled-coil protein SlyX